MIAVIMQPTYLSWIGYFDLMDNADVFVLLDAVQFEKQSWQQRNRIKTAKESAAWLTVPVLHDLGQKINAVKINNAQPWRRKHWKTIEQEYQRSAYWARYKDGLAAIYSQPWENLMELNIALIEFIRQQLGIKTRLIKASEIPVSGEKVGLLVNICHHLKADVYLSPVGSACYIEPDNIFGAGGITLRYHRYEHPAYTQLYSGFLPFMSALDLLFNEGPKSLEIIRSGRLKEEQQ
jgi:hypothetical protein